MSDVRKLQAHLSSFCIFIYKSKLLLPPTSYFQGLALQSFSCLLSAGFPENSRWCFYCSAMLLLLVSILGMLFASRDARAQTVTQPDSHISVSEGASLELSCKYEYSGIPSLFWYVQYPSKGLQLLLKYYSGNTLVKGDNDFVAEFRRNDFSFNLQKSSARLSDSAVYFCAVSGTVLETAGEPSTNHSWSWRFWRLKISSCAIFKSLLPYDNICK